MRGWSSSKLGRPVVVEGDDLAVEHRVGAAERLAERRAARGSATVASLPCREVSVSCPPSIDEQHPHAVPLHLERPVLVVVRQVARPRPRASGGGRAASARAVGSAGGLMRWIIHWLPLVLEQRVLAVDLLAVQRDDHLVVAQLLGFVGAGVPDASSSPRRTALRDVAAEREVLHRVVLGAHREVVRLVQQRDALGHRPRPEHAVVLEAEVPVETAGVVLLHDEARFAGSRCFRCEPAPARACSRSRASCGTRAAAPSPSWRCVRAMGDNATRPPGRSPAGRRPCEVLHMAWMRSQPLP